MKTKVFGIGFHRTGTTSLAHALHYLGYRVTGPNGTNNPNIAKEVYEMAFELVNKFDAFQDNPWPILYRELDEEFPRSKFVLTVRPTSDWIRSVLHTFNEEQTSMRQWIYGVGNPKGHEDVYVARYERHNREVREHFKGREKDLLVLDLTAGEGWEKLCPFLGKPIPPVRFPCANTTSAREKMHGKESSYLWRTYIKCKRRAKQLIGMTSKKWE